MKLATIERVLDARSARRPIALVTDLATGKQFAFEHFPDASSAGFSADAGVTIAEALDSDQSGEIELDGVRHFIQCFAPAHRILIVGAVHIAQALAPLSQILGYDVHIVDPRRAFASDERFPGASISHEWPDEALAKWRADNRTAVVTLTHDPKLDDPALIAALRSEAFYIGALGSKKTHGARVERLQRAGFSPEQIARIHGPAGLDIGAKSPAEIALSVMAQITIARRGKKHP